MDTFENASPPHEQPDKVLARCWECGETKMCFEHIVCCTGTHFHTCVKCREAINRRDYVYSQTEPGAESNAER